MILTKLLERNLTILSLSAFLPGFPVPIEIKHLTSGFRSPVLELQMFTASPSTLLTGLFVPSAPSINYRALIETGLKKLVTTDVARAASQIVAGMLPLSGRV